MQRERLFSALAPKLGDKLAGDLIGDFLKVRTDLATHTLERASPGKFVETFVQCLQHLTTGSFETAPKVDHYLDKVAPEALMLPEGLRIVATRVARSIYTLRNKRNIAHKGELDPNVIDLALVHHANVWVLSELVRSVAALPMAEAAALVQLLQVPVGSLIEDIDGVRLVHADVPVTSELLILLHSHYPDQLPTSVILESLSRRSAKTVRNRLRELAEAKLLQGSGSAGYRLTTAGHRRAAEIINAIISDV